MMELRHEHCSVQPVSNSSRHIQRKNCLSSTAKIYLWTMMIQVAYSDFFYWRLCKKRWIFVSNCILEKVK